MIEKILERLEETRWTTEFDMHCTIENAKLDNCIEIVQEVAKDGGWIPFKQRELTQEEKEEFYYEIEYLLVGKLPDDNTEILVCYKNGDVHADTFFNDCGECYLDSGHELVDEVIAWQPLPAPYQKGEPHE